MSDLQPPPRAQPEVRDTENLFLKARRMLGDGKLKVTRLRPRDGLIVAECEGDHDTYALGYDPKHAEWRCTCAAYTRFGRRCSHVIALQLVTGWLAR